MLRGLWFISENGVNDARTLRMPVGATSSWDTVSSARSGSSSSRTAPRILRWICSNAPTNSTCGPLRPRSHFTGLINLAGDVNMYRPGYSPPDLRGTNEISETAGRAGQLGSSLNARRRSAMTSAERPSSTWPTTLPSAMMGPMVPMRGSPMKLSVDAGNAPSSATSDSIASPSAAVSSETKADAVKWFNRPHGAPSGVCTGHMKPQASGRSFLTEVVFTSLKNWPR
mmetsp:Transcript_1404/g.4174  ORF Transcript_1404/g.4174 Transcript_1404/m.4174 type:complete len:227 (+) Transcript_1404:1646-2326(+)